MFLGAPIEDEDDLSGSLREKQMMCTSVEDQPDLGQVIEDNILALLDTIGVKHADDIEDDKISFIEAVSALCIAGKQPKAPTWRVHEAIFRILEGNDSMVLNLASYSLLVEIAQQYPHMMVGEDTANGTKKVIIVNNKIWCPFHADSGVEDKRKGGISTHQANPTHKFCEEFFSLLEDIKGKIGEKPWAASTDAESEEDLESTNYKVIGLMLKFKYLFSILEYDFKCRFEVYKDGKKKEIISSSYLVQLFEEARRKPLVELLLNLIASTGVSTNRGIEVLHLQEFSSSIQALLEMRLSLELESVRTINTSPRKARQDAPRSQPIFELVNEIVYYNKPMFEYLLQAMEDTDCKLRIIFYNFIKDIPKPLTREKIRDPDNMTVQDLLNCLKEVTAARKVFNCIESNILQVLLASAFKAGLRHMSSDGISTGTLEMCKLLKTAFKNLQTISNEFGELHSAAKQALITAEALIMLAN